MSLFLSLCLLAAPAIAATPLVVARVVRQGLPPYEDEARIYWLEGAGCQALKPGEVLLLERPKEKRSLGELQVTEVLATHALARLAKPGAAFPMRGDLAIPRGPLPGLPGLPKIWGVAPARSLNPATPVLSAPPPILNPAPVRPAEPAQGKAPAHPASTVSQHREPLFFRLGDPELSPGGQAKLKTWAAAWDRQGRWTLSCPPWPGEAPSLLAQRCAAISSALKSLGVAEVEVLTESGNPGSRFPVIYVGVKSW